MKEIKAIIRPFKLLKVLEALKEIKTLPGITISEIIGFGKAEINTKDIKIIDDKILSVPRTKLEIVVDDSMVDNVLNIIQKVAHTGNSGDGKIFVSNVDEVIKIRTNERSKVAI
ncbi:MAG: P-II family nitrogen regulator [bacterium]|nr:P-II family nitrogen regulator [bacterium]